MSNGQTMHHSAADFDRTTHLSDEEFLQQFGVGYLLHHGQLGGAQDVGSLDSTAYAAPRQLRTRSAGAAFLIFPIRLSGRTAFTDFITVGRTANNDIVLADPSISVFHALIKTEVGEDGETRFLVQDAGSKNGTFVGEQPAPTQDMRTHVQLRDSGTSVRFGSVELTFIRLVELRKLLRGVKR
jgi:hypothetical protein